MRDFAKQTLEKANTFLRSYNKEISIEENGDSTYSMYINQMLMFHKVSEDRLPLNIKVLFFAALTMQ